MLGNRLKELRIKRGMTQESLAEMLGLDARAIWRYENDKNKPSSDVIAGMAQQLETTADYLLGLTDDPEPPSSTLTPDEQALISAYRRGAFSTILYMIGSRMESALT